MNDNTTGELLAFEELDDLVQERVVERYGQDYMASSEDIDMMMEQEIDNWCAEMLVYGFNVYDVNCSGLSSPEDSFIFSAEVNLATWLKATCHADIIANPDHCSVEVVMTRRLDDMDVRFGWFGDDYGDDEDLSDDDFEKMEIENEELADDILYFADDKAQELWFVMYREIERMNGFHEIGRRMSECGVLFTEDGERAEDEM